MKKNILILGSGGRESAFVWKFSKDKSIDKIFCIPGNAGTENLGTNLDLQLDDYDRLLEWKKTLCASREASVKQLSGTPGIIEKCKL